MSEVQISIVVPALNEALNLTPLAEQIDAALAQIRAGFAELTKNLKPGDGVPLLLFEMQQQQQQQ